MLFFPFLGIGASLIKLHAVSKLSFLNVGKYYFYKSVFEKWGDTKNKTLWILRRLKNTFERN